MSRCLAEMPSAQPPRIGDSTIGQRASEYADQIFVAFISSILLLYVCVFFYFLYATMIRVPFSDMFSYINDYFAYRQNGDLLHYLWMPHTQHRLVWTRLAIALDINTLRGVGYPIIIVSTSCLISVPLLIHREMTRGGMLPEVAYVGSLLTVLLVLTTANVVVCSIALEEIYPETLAFAVLAIVLFDGDLEADKLSNYRRAAALLAAIGSAFGSATGLVVWPILVWTSWRGRADRRWTLATLGVGTAFVALYAHDLPVPQSTSEALVGAGQFYDPAHLLKIGEYLLTYLGLPWTRAANLILVGRLIGAALLTVGFAVIVQRGILRPPADRLERIAVGLIMFSLATAALASVGRVDERADVAVPVRYSVYLVPLHIGLLFLVMPWLNLRWQVLSQRRLSQLAIALMVSFLFVQQLAAGRAAVAITRSITAAMSRFYAGERDVEMMQYVGNLDGAEHAVELMRREAIYVGRR